MFSRILNKRLILNLKVNNKGCSSIFNKQNSSISRFYTTNSSNDVTSTPTTTTTPTPSTDINNYIMDPNKLNKLNNEGETIKVNLDDFKHVLDPELVQITGLPTFIEVCLNQIHHMTGLPWLTIVPVFTLFIRSALFPLSVKHRLNSLKLLEIKPQLDKFKEQQKLNRLNKASLEVRSQTSNKITTLLKEKGCHPLLSYILPLSNLPFLISSVIAFREMASTYPSLKDAGILWFTDLSQHDPLFILPVICSSLYLVATELAFSKNNMSPIMTAIKWVSRGMALMLIAFSPSIPSICYLYWIPSALFTIAQTIAFNSKKFSTWLGLPSSIKSGDAVFNIFKEDNEIKKKEIKYAPELPTSTTNNNNNNTINTKFTNKRK